MASAPSDPGPVAGRIDREGRLVTADPRLAELQLEAGSRLGAELALPQVAAVARLARKLGVPVSRPAVAAGASRDVELWVRAVPDGDDVLLSLERWVDRSPAPARLGALVAHDQEVGLGESPDEWTTDEELRIVSLSPGLAEKLGVTMAEAMGQKLTRLVKLEEDESGELPLLSAAASRTSFEGQQARPRRGDDQLLVLNGRAIGGADRFAGFEGEAVSEAQATPAEAAGSAFDQALDDALRTPLDQIIDAADRIVQQSDGPLRSDYAEYAGDIAIAARHLLSVIRSMSGDSSADDDRIDLAELALDAAGMLESAAEPRGIVIALQPSAPLLAHGESRGVIQILVNLIGNAVRHSPDGGTISLSFDSDDQHARVHVADQGQGIAASDQQRIFERFERASPGEGGTGLGLAIARRLARSMDGEVTLQSQPGAGARFTLELRRA